MLIVSRSVQQTVLVGEFDGFERLLKVTVLEVLGKKVRLAFELIDELNSDNHETWEQVPTSNTEPEDELDYDSTTNGPSDAC